MKRTFQLLGALALLVAAAAAPLVSHVSAQEPPVKQIQLSEKHVTQLLAAQPDITAVQKKMPANQTGGPIDQKLIDEFETVSKKHGFASFMEYDEVFTNISMIMSLYDPSTDSFIDPKEALRKQMAEVKADKGIPEKERKQILDEMAAAMKTAEPIRFPGNLVLVKKYREKLDAAMQ